MQIDKLIVPADIHRQMSANLEAAYPHEGCGIMIGAEVDGTCELWRVVDAQNRNEDRAHDRFEIDPQVYLQTERELAPHENVVGFFHSHPDCPELPSETDRTFALGWPGFVWIIYRVEQGTVAGMRAWVLGVDEQFDEIRVQYTDRTSQTAS